MGKYVRILCGVMAVLVAATALGLWQLAEAPQYVAAAESRGQAKPVSFGTDTALVPVHLESQTLGGAAGAAGPGSWTRRSRCGSAVRGGADRRRRAENGL